MIFIIENIGLWIYRICSNGFLNKESVLVYARLDFIY